MNKIQEYCDFQSKQLVERFQQIRSGKDDSDVKGGENEQTVVKFLKEHCPAKHIVTNTSIIDSYGNSTDEIDVCVCNADQPFLPSPGSHIIAEGVDFVVQVKSSIPSRSEIKRIINNSQSVKKVSTAILIWRYCMF